MQMARCAYRRRDRRRAGRSSGGRISSRDSRKSRRAWRSSAPTTMYRRSASPRSWRAFRAGTTGTRARAVPWARAHSSAVREQPVCKLRLEPGRLRRHQVAGNQRRPSTAPCASGAARTRSRRADRARAVRGPSPRALRRRSRSACRCAGRRRPRSARAGALGPAHVEAATGSARGTNSGRILKRYHRPAPAARTGSPDAKSSRAPAKPTSRSKARSCRKAWTFASLR
jgi:hypothetical protein